MKELERLKKLCYAACRPYKCSDCEGVFDDKYPECPLCGSVYGLGINTEMVALARTMMPRLIKALEHSMPCHELHNPKIDCEQCMRRTGISEILGDNSMKRGKTEVETLKLNGWGVGDILQGTETWGDGTLNTDRLLITAIGQEGFLCKWDYRCDGVYEKEVGNTTLTSREWRKIGEYKGLGGEDE